MTTEQKQDRLRILEMIHEVNASHIGSCLSVVDIISAIYKAKKPSEKFVLSAGHSAVALYAVLEREGYLTNPNLKDLNIHPDRNPLRGIDVSTGSLGQGLPIAIGMALADRTKNVWVVSTDGEMAEGSMWEALRIGAEYKLENLRLFVNANGFGAYDATDNKKLEDRINAFGWGVTRVNGHDPAELQKAIESPWAFRPTCVMAYTTSEQLPFLQGLDAHYHVMSEEEYGQARQIITQG